MFIRGLSEGSKPIMMGIWLSTFFSRIFMPRAGSQYSVFSLALLGISLLLPLLTPSCAPQTEQANAASRFSAVEQNTDGPAAAPQEAEK